MILPVILKLFKGKDMLIEVFLKLFICKIDVKLFKAVDLKT